MRTAFVVSTPSAAALRALNYNADVETLRRRHPGRTQALGALTRAIGGSFGMVFTRVDCETSYGTMLLTQADTFASEPSGRIVRFDCLPDRSKQIVKKWQILIAGAGQMGEGNLFGRSIIADGRLEGMCTGPDTLALAFDNPGSSDNLWVYAFLNTRLGLAAVRACAYGTSIPRLRPDLLAELPVPMASDGVRGQVARLVQQCVSRREDYIRYIGMARRVLEDMPEMREAHAMCGQRRGRHVVRDDELPTMVAWTFASAGEALRYLRKQWASRLHDYLEMGGLFTGPRFARIPCSAPAGVDLLSQRDVFMIRRMPRRVALPKFDPERLFAQESHLLIACDGQFTEGSLFGRVEDASAGLTSQAITQHILRLVPIRGTKSWLYAFLSTPVGYRLLQSTAVGTSVPMMRHDLVADLPVPPVDPELVKVVDSHVEDAMRARREADAAESEAIRIIEEEVLPAWLA
ncbi:MAG: hypothetical protein QM820_29575 [Minicystis sp.]